jgi:hypothetical protein
MAYRMFARDNIPGIQTGWKLKLFLFPGMVIQWFVYMSPRGRYSRVKQSTREARSPLMTWVYALLFYTLVTAYLWTKLNG